MSHTLEEHFAHFLSYQNWNGLSWATKRLLQIAYEHGNRLDRGDGNPMEQAWFAGRNVWGSTVEEWLEFMRSYDYAPPQLIDAIRALIVKGG